MVSGSFCTYRLIHFVSENASFVTFVCSLSGRAGCRSGHLAVYLLVYCFICLKLFFSRRSTDSQSRSKKYNKMHRRRQFQETPLHPVISAAQCNAVGAFCDVICVHVAVNFDYPNGKLSKNHTFVHKFSLTLPQL